jgi:5'-phosphate synthase pdxT subunit
MPVLGTCAGLILLADKIDNDSRRHFGTMDISVVRNAYGRQLGSFEAEAELKDIGKVPMRFIRAPYIDSVGDGVEVLGKLDGRIVAAREGNQLVTAFHPELTDSTSIHQYFLNMC